MPSISSSNSSEEGREVWIQDSMTSTSVKYETLIFFATRHAISSEETNNAG